MTACLLPAAAAAQVSLFADPGADARMAAAVSALDRTVADGGWPLLPDGPVFRRGDVDPRIEILRRRLAASGDLASQETAGQRFDRLLDRAVRRFQGRHGLHVDGIVGRETRAALNVPAAHRLAVLSLNRTRLSAFASHIRSEGIVINIPDASLELLENGRRVLRSAVIVGRPDWPTPVLHSAIFAIDVHPVWYVPPRIADREILPRARRDPDYLASRGFRVFVADADGAPVHEVPYTAVDFSGATGSAYRLRQESGPQNPLGVVKFVFDNPYSVFLHDTPERSLFGRSYRSLSHGCVRVAAALELARYLAANDPGLGADALTGALQAGETRRLPLNRPIPIHLVYLTAWVDRLGSAQFRRDIYGQDRPGHGTDPALAACNARPPGDLPGG